MIAVTPTAAGQMQKLLAKQATARGLRVGIKAGGCSGFEYVFEWEAEPKPDDLVFEGPNGVRVWVDARSHRLLDGTTLDYDTSLVSRGFVFQNPNAKQTCGCGTSFSVG
jgi:iron-sulfur cluster assembly protein